MKGEKPKINSDKHDAPISYLYLSGFSSLKDKSSLLTLIEVVKSAYEGVVLLISQVLSVVLLEKR
ncbi:MAG: hypothetical protein ACXQTI_09270 [Candidatus Nezhaarchaeales archaeon]